MKLTINKQDHEFDADPEMPLLWVLRDVLNMTGTKYGCGVGMCGTCVVLADGIPIRSCQSTVASVLNKEIITVEGLSDDLTHPLQIAWQEVGVSQCGYCQPGQLMSAAALLNHNSNPTDKDIVDAVNGNFCRCGTYNRIKEAIKLAAEG